MKSIYKYILQDADVQSVSMPEGAKILCVQVQYGAACLWAEVDTDKPSVDRTIEMFGTGYEMRCDMGIERQYIGSYQLIGGALVFHVYENLGA